MRHSSIALIAIAMVLGARTGHAQFYIGAEGGWTSLDSTKDTLAEKTEAALFFGTPTAAQRTFSDGFNAGVRAGYQWGSWRIEEEYNHRENGATAQRLAFLLDTGISGSRTADAIMTNLLYDFEFGWPVTPHLGIGVGAVDLSDSLRAAGIGRISNSSDWEFGYQAIAGVRYDITSILAAELDYRYFATTDASFRSKPYALSGPVASGIAVPAIGYSSGYSTNSFVASLIYRLVPPPAPPGASLPPSGPFAR